ncbi:hypothetical protein LX36DRAFT_13579 [Colletotrichum falcatum]|nr:hypothetical protein LX36DRAFT_13579 [Colletotrichum falcatum]
MSKGPSPLFVSPTSLIAAILIAHARATPPRYGYDVPLAVHTCHHQAERNFHSLQSHLQLISHSPFLPGRRRLSSASYLHTNAHTYTHAHTQHRAVQ